MEYEFKTILKNTELIEKLERKISDSKYVSKDDMNWYKLSGSLNEYGFSLSETKLITDRGLGDRINIAGEILDDGEFRTVRLSISISIINEALFSVVIFCISMVVGGNAKAWYSKLAIFLFGSFFCVLIIIVSVYSIKTECEDYRKIITKYLLE